MTAADVRSTTGANNKLILDTNGLDPRLATSLQVRHELRVRESEMTEQEQAVAWELGQLLEDRARME